jgi:hypothetical protein
MLRNKKFSKFYIVFPSKMQFLLISQQLYCPNAPKVLRMNFNWKKIGRWILLLIFTSCEKEITVNLPEHSPKICVDGRIEPGLPPFVILTRNMPYFGSTDINVLQNMFVHNAMVKVSNGAITIQLVEFCTQNIPDSLLPLVTAFTGVDTVSLKNFNYCFYTTFNTDIWGEVGKTYRLTVEVEGKSLSATTTILAPVPLDSLWYKYYKTNSKGDSLGFVFAHLTDPPAQGNAYRWLAMRKGKDQSFVPPPGSVFDDKYINNQSFDFAYNRGKAPGSTAEDDYNEESGWFKKGDTVIVKFSAIDRGVYEFFRQMELAIYGQDNPFAAPASVPSNVSPREYALGVWAGYGPHIDTVIFK